MAKNHSKRAAKEEPTAPKTPIMQDIQKCDPNLVLLLEALRTSRATERLAFDKEVEDAKAELKKTLARNWVTYILGVIVFAVLAIWNFAPFQEMIINKIDERYVDKSIREKLADVEERLAKADRLTHLLTLKTRAIQGDVAAYNELMEISKEDKTAAIFASDVEASFTAQFLDFSPHYSMRDLSLKRRRINKGYDELLGMLAETSLDGNERANVIKNLPDSGVDDKTCAEKFVEIVENPQTLQERCAAIQGLIYLSTKNDTIFSKELTATMSVDEVKRWWNTVETHTPKPSDDPRRGKRIMTISAPSK